MSGYYHHPFVIIIHSDWPRAYVDAAPLVERNREMLSVGLELMREEVHWEQHRLMYLH